MYAAGDYAEGGIRVNKGVELTDVEYPSPPGRARAGPREGVLRRDRRLEEEAVSNFLDYAGPLTETILLGNLAVWKEGPVKWDAKDSHAGRPQPDGDRQKRVPRRLRTLTT